MIFEHIFLKDDTNGLGERGELIPWDGNMEDGARLQYRGIQFLATFAGDGGLNVQVELDLESVTPPTRVLCIEDVTDWIDALDPELLAKESTRLTERYLEADNG